MKNLLKLEELAMYIAATMLMLSINNNFVLYLLVLFTPDISMLGYAVNPKLGAVIYNLVHHKAVAILLAGIGMLMGNLRITYVGLLLFAHSSMDRTLEYGLKYPDAFKHTHLD